MASTDAHPVPIKNTAYRVYFPILDNTGALVTGAAGLDSERSLDGATFADCTNEATEIATASGVYFLDLTSTEMNTDCTCVIVKTTTTNAKTTTLILYPQELGDIKVDVQSLLGTAWLTPGTAGTPDVNTKLVGGQTASASGTVTFPNATLASTTNITAGTIATVTNVTTVNGLAANVITAASIATDALTAAKFAADCLTAAKIADGAIDAATFAAGAINAAAIAADAITAAKVASDVTDEIWAKACAEPGGVPAVTATAIQVLSWLLVLSRNKITQTATTTTLRNDADSGTIASSAVSDDATTLTRGEFA